MANKRLQKAFGIGALVLALGAGIAGCEERPEPKIKIIELKVSVSYANGTTENFYSPADSKEIQSGDENYKVIKVTLEPSKEQK